MERPTTSSILRTRISSRTWVCGEGVVCAIQWVASSAEVGKTDAGGHGMKCARRISRTSPCHSFSASCMDGSRGVWGRGQQLGEPRFTSSTQVRSACYSRVRSLRVSECPDACKLGLETTPFNKLFCGSDTLCTADMLNHQSCALAWRGLPGRISLHVCIF